MKIKFNSIYFAIFIEQVEFPTDFCVTHEKNFPLEHDSTLKNNNYEHYSYFGMK